MYRIGFIDDDRDSYEDYRVRLARKDIELLYPDGITEMPEMIEWLLSADSGYDSRRRCLYLWYSCDRDRKSVV